jgi:hypothetical protein
VFSKVTRSVFAETHAPVTAQYIPDQLAQVRSNLGALKADFDKKNYEGVLDSGQPVLGAAQALVGAALAKKDLIARGFEDQARQPALRLCMRQRGQQVVFL